jgi:hypothetical protein
MMTFFWRSTAAVINRVGLAIFTWTRWLIGAGTGINFGEYCRAEMKRLGMDSGITLSWSNLTFTVMQQVLHISITI